MATGELLAPEDGAPNWTTPADLAQAAAVVLSRDGEFDGRTTPPAASQSIDLEELAAAASEVHGRQITRVTVSEADYRDALIGRGTPEMFVDFFLSMFSASRAGDFATDD